MNARSTEATARILVVDDHAQARQSMAFILGEAGYRVDCCSSAIEALDRLQSHNYDLIITDLQMPGMSGLEFIRALESRRIDAQVVMVTAHATVTSAVDAMRHGAFDYIEKPFNADQLESLVNRALRHGTVVERRSSVPSGQDQSVVMIGDSRPMQQLKARIAKVAPTEETVLITGESGTGKELVAQLLHAGSRRAHGSLVSLNCPALSPQLMESELFGHERGAFTSADAPRTGRFELADQGTILLDEVTEIELPLQAKLLRVLQEKAFERVGSSATRQVDVRVIASTNRELREEVERGAFREDLYFRLAVVPLPVPPLRQRPTDILPLVEYFLAQTAARLGSPAADLRDDARDLLVNYQWPGNVRELENIITRASVLSDGSEVTADQLRPWLIGGDAGAQREGADTITAGMSLHEMEKKLIEATLDHYDSHRARTAQALGIGVRTLANKLRSYGYKPRARAYSHAG